MDIKKHPEYDPHQETVVIRPDANGTITILLKGRNPRIFRNEAHATKFITRKLHAAYRDNLLLDNYDKMERNA